VAESKAAAVEFDDDEGDELSPERELEQLLIAMHEQTEVQKRIKYEVYKLTEQAKVLVSTMAEVSGEAYAIMNATQRQQYDGRRRQLLNFSQQFVRVYQPLANSYAALQSHYHDCQQFRANQITAEVELNEQIERHAEEKARLVKKLGDTQKRDEDKLREGRLASPQKKRRQGSSPQKKQRKKQGKKDKQSVGSAQKGNKDK
jgi:hypothetical protein